MPEACVKSNDGSRSSGELAYEFYRFDLQVKFPSFVKEEFTYP